jgi:hypothetical protein
VSPVAKTWTNGTISVGTIAGSSSTDKDAESPKQITNHAAKSLPLGKLS